MLRNPYQRLMSVSAESALREGQVGGEPLDTGDHRPEGVIVAAGPRVTVFEQKGIDKRTYVRYSHRSFLPRIGWW